MMKTILYAAICALFAAVASPALAEALVLSAPRVPSAGQPTTIVFEAMSPGHDLDAGTLPAASVEGSSIRIDLNTECSPNFCELTGPWHFKAEMPALEQGEYQVEVFPTAQSSQSTANFVYSVGPEVPTVSSTRPAEGAWTNAAQPGTGFHFQQRGSLLSVAQFDFSELRGQWRHDITLLRGDSALILLREYTHGTCFGCAPPIYQPASRLGGKPMLITFDSARRARVELADGTVVPVTSLPFGVNYVDFSGLRDIGDAEFGPLALPDLSGTWTNQGKITSFAAFVRQSGGVNFPPVSPSLTELACRRNQMGEAVCFLYDNWDPNGPIPGAGPPYQAVARLGDIEENRIRMTRILGPNIGLEFFMVRIPSIE